MSIFDFMSEGVEEAIGAMNQQVQRLEGQASALRNVIAPLENGGWIGEGADTFFEDARQFLAHLEQLRDHKSAFIQALSQTMQRIQEATQTIVSTING